MNKKYLLVFGGLGALVVLCAAFTTGMTTWVGNFYGDSTSLTNAATGGDGIGPVLGSNSPTLYNANLTGTTTATAVDASTLIITNPPVTGNWFTFATIVANNNGTNFVVDLTNAVYQKITATNNIAFVQHTNGPGAVSVKIRPGGSDRLVLCPTNWVFLQTNNSYLSGSWRVFTVTNASNGSGPRAGYLSIVADGTDPTNAVANFVTSP